MKSPKIQKELPKTKKAPPKMESIKYSGGTIIEIKPGYYIAQISIAGIQKRKKTKDLEFAKKWLAKMASGDIPLTASQENECKLAYQLIAEQDKTLLELVKIGMEAEEPKTTIPLGEAIDKYLKSKAGSISELTYNDYSLYLFQLQAYLGDDTDLLTVGREGIAGYLNRYKKSSSLP